MALAVAFTPTLHQAVNKFFAANNVPPTEALDTPEVGINLLHVFVTCLLHVVITCLWEGHADLACLIGFRKPFCCQRLSKDPT